MKLETYVLEMTSKNQIGDCIEYLQQTITDSGKYVFIHGSTETIRIDDSPKKFREFVTTIEFKGSTPIDVPFIEKIRESIKCFTEVESWLLFTKNLHATSIWTNPEIKEKLL